NMDVNLFSDLNEEFGKIFDYMEIVGNAVAGVGYSELTGKAEIVRGEEILDRICEQNWECSSWSECENGEQERHCVDVNDCGTEREKPGVVRECEEEVENIDEISGGIDPFDEEAKQQRIDYILEKGKTIELEGRIEILHYDDFENLRSTNEYFVYSDGERYKVYFEEEPFGNYFADDKLVHNKLPDLEREVDIG
ncbi:MAG: hypothetical protein ABIB47_02880, partial [Candidatus Woesearchaeota archaeon]